MSSRGWWCSQAGNKSWKQNTRTATAAQKSPDEPLCDGGPLISFTQGVKQTSLRCALLWLMCCCRTRWRVSEKKEPPRVTNCALSGNRVGVSRGIKQLQTRHSDEKELAPLSRDQLRLKVIERNVGRFWGFELVGLTWCTGWWPGDVWRRNISSVDWGVGRGGGGGGY